MLRQSTILLLPSGVCFSTPQKDWHSQDFWENVNLINLYQQKLWSKKSKINIASTKPANEHDPHLLPSISQSHSLFLRSHFNISIPSLFKFSRKLPKLCTPSHFNIRMLGELWELAYFVTLTSKHIPEIIYFLYSKQKIAFHNHTLMMLQISKVLESKRKTRVLGSHLQQLCTSNSKF
jgi:hypothetical protein